MTFKPEPELNVKRVDGKPRISSMPYLYDIAEGNVSGHSVWESFGYNGDIDISAEDVWSVGGTYIFPAAAQQMELVSSSAEDDPERFIGCRYRYPYCHTRLSRQHRSRCNRRHKP